MLNKQSLLIECKFSENLGCFNIEIKIFMVYKKNKRVSLWKLAIFCRNNKNYTFLTLSTIALNAAGLLRARSARTLRLISMPALWISPINFE